MNGRLVRLQPVDPSRQAGDLFEVARDPGDDLWRFMFYGPFATMDEFRAYLDPMAESTDPMYFAVVDTATGRASGIVSYLRIEPEHGCIEIGHIWFAPWLQRTPAATEAIFLLMRQVFEEWGYRRLEWKCDAANKRSRRAAERFGFTFEGIFRRHRIAKGKNRNTAWFSLLESEWPAVRDGFEAWLAPKNFDEDGRQRRSLSAMRMEHLAGRRDATGIKVRDVQPPDEAVWRDLWADYVEFYESSVPQQVTDATWRRILDPQAPIGSVVAELDGEVIGFANYVVHEYTWSDRPECLMEDLFVRPRARSGGAGRALTQHLLDRARVNGWAKLYWITQADNLIARRLYDAFTPPDGFIEYSIELE
jgi:RimJ/RimL family protein N-acetyltransferase